MDGKYSIKLMHFHFFSHSQHECSCINSLRLHVHNEDSLCMTSSQNAFGIKVERSHNFKQFPDNFKKCLLAC